VNGGVGCLGTTLENECVEAVQKMCRNVEAAIGGFWGGPFDGAQDAEGVGGVVGSLYQWEGEIRTLSTVVGVWHRS
jgi:hypothetical protein